MIRILVDCQVPGPPWDRARFRPGSEETPDQPPPTPAPPQPPPTSTPARAKRSAFQGNISRNSGLEGRAEFRSGPVRRARRHRHPAPPRSVGPARAHRCAPRSRASRRRTGAGGESSRRLHTVLATGPCQGAERQGRQRRQTAKESRLHPAAGVNRRVSRRRRRRRRRRRFRRRRLRRYQRRCFCRRRSFF
jgi:hypothetical protein